VKITFKHRISNYLSSDMQNEFNRFVRDVEYIRPSFFLSKLPKGQIASHQGPLGVVIDAAGNRTIVISMKDT
jgi:hypothetical protein